VALVGTADAPRPRVQVTTVDLEAHAARLAQLCRKAGRVVWEEVVREEEAVA
jgi:DNA polymerase-3 subunit epsilon